MIWILASIPFWSLSAFIFVLTSVAMVTGMISDRCQGEQYRNLILGGCVMVVFSGVLAIIAAKLCSL